MNAIHLLLAVAVSGAGPARAALPIAEQGRPRSVILRQPGATDVERFAAKELAEALTQITGARFDVEEAGAKPPRSAIVVGPGPAAQKLFPEVRLDSFGSEELIIRTKGNHLLLAGGRPRGTLYAVNRFLETECGVRRWAPWASQLPRQRTLKLAKLDRREQPAFEYREPFWFPAFDGLWAARNYYNGNSARLTPELGGQISYKGFVHTFYPLVPPETHFAAHPDWFSEIKGQRTNRLAQLCLTNPQLRDFVVERVKAWLRESPGARIVSVSQNDWYGACQCPKCKAVDDAEGSHAGTLLEFVNHVAAKIEPEYPQVAVDTLAYQYTRKPPRTVKPRPNVIVRLCSIECNFRVPLEDPANASFADDIRGWSKICDRLYVWDYTTDFAHYVQPHPNWFVLGPNLRFFQQHRVRGVFEQGAYQSHGAEMAELRAWVLARLLWNPKQDDRALIHEFLEGYYGRAAAKPIREYLELMTTAATGWNLTCFSRTDTPFHRFETLAKAERLWQQAEAAARNDPETLWRVWQGHLPLRYVWLSRWDALREECRKLGAEWPLASSRRAVADEWHQTATGPGPSGWSRLTHLNESGLTPEKFVERFAKDPPEPAR